MLLCIFFSQQTVILIFFQVVCLKPGSAAPVHFISLHLYTYNIKYIIFYYFIVMCWSTVIGINPFLDKYCRQLCWKINEPASRSSGGNILWLRPIHFPTHSIKKLLCLDKPCCGIFRTLTIVWFSAYQCVKSEAEIGKIWLMGVICACVVAGWNSSWLWLMVRAFLKKNSFHFKERSASFWATFFSKTRSCDWK